MDYQNRAAFYHAFELPTLIYAFIYTVLLFDNFSAITLPIWVVATLTYVYICLKRLGLPVKTGFWFYGAGMFLLAISVMCTGSTPLQFFGNVGILLLLIALLLHSFRNDADWTLAKYFSAYIYAIFGPIGCIGDLFTDAHADRTLRKNTKKAITTYILIGIAIAVPMLMILGALLYFSDAVFANILDRSFLDYLKPGKILGWLTLFAFALASSYCTIRFLGKPNLTNEVHDHRNFEPVVAITVLLPITLIYGLFCGIQIFSLFLGKMQLPEGYTYAQYAREGFFQLLFVCIINVVIVLFVNGLFRENLVQKILMTLISVCTYIMLASSAFRMLLYIRAYQLTFYRILVLWALLVIALLLIGVIIEIYHRSFPLARYMMAVVTVLFLALSFMHPDYIIASYNLHHTAEYTEEYTREYKDHDYLATLSTDAAPAIMEYYRSGDKESPDEDGWILTYARDHEWHYSSSPRRFNVSRYIAHRQTQGILESDEQLLLFLSR